MKKNNKKRIELITFSFPQRDLHLPLVLLKEYAMMDERVKKTCEIRLNQFVIDEEPEVAPGIIAGLTAKRADIYGFSVYIWNWRQSLATAHALKEATGARIIFGGPQAAGLAEAIMDRYPFVDAVFLGESEEAFRQYLAGTDPERIANLVRRGSDRRAEWREKFDGPLTGLPSPWLNAEYRAHLEASPQPVRAALETSRGCTFRCGYCGWGGGRVRLFDMEKQVKPGLKFLLDHPRVEWVYITDANPLIRREHGRELLRFLAENNRLKKPVVFELNPELIDDEYLEWITRLGQDEFALGLQSTSPHVLQLIRRPFDATRYRESIARIRVLNPGIHIVISLILGLPADTYDGFLDSLDFALRLAPESLYIHELLVLPGSDFHRDPEKYGIEFMPEPPHKLLHHTTFPAADYNRAKRLAYLTVLFSKMGMTAAMLVLHRRTGLRPITLYERFSKHLEEIGLDPLGGEIDTASSWFFDRYIDRFQQDDRRKEQLQAEFGLFTQTMEGDHYA